MARPVRATVSTVTASGVIPLDSNCQYFVVGVGCVVSGTATYTVQHTFDDVFARTFNPATATWFPHSVANMVGATANQEGNFLAPCTGVRLNVTAVSGSVTMTVIQQGL